MSEILRPNTHNVERRVSRGGRLPRLELRAAGSGPSKIVGYAAVYYRPGDPGTEYELEPGMFERITPGAFDRAIREDDVRALFNHDPSLILGRTGAGTLRLTSDAIGLRYEIDPPDTQTGRDVVVSLRRGDVSGSSFAFRSRRTNAKREGAILVRELLEVQLFDVGPVTYPAYESSTSGARQERPLTPAERDRQDMEMLLLDVFLSEAAEVHAGRS